MRAWYARHFTTPKHYIGVVAMEQRRDDGDAMDGWAAYIEAIPHGGLAMDEYAPALERLSPVQMRAVASWGAKLSEEDARWYFPPERFPQLADVPYRA